MPDSPERGFELALYYVVTHDAKRGGEAVAWALSHPCNHRQFSLILNWCNDLISADQRRKLTAACPAPPIDDRQLMQSLEVGGFKDPRALYAACEHLIALRFSEHDDPRLAAPQFFSQLPIEFLLSLRPEQIEHPGWMTHVAALALVALDPNLEASQYVQSWAMEDRQMLREGPGVAYEFLWADPYLPGIGYQNLDPWVLDASGRLFARANWDEKSCWIAISTRGVEEENCPAGWRSNPAIFGRMTLIPMTSRCAEIPQPKSNETAILWQLKPNEPVFYHENKQQLSAHANAAGILLLSAGVSSKVCAAR